MAKYVTRQGDTFDIIALLFYDDEFKAAEIIKANPEYAGTVVFDAGVTLEIPALPAEQPTTLPPWRR